MTHKPKLTGRWRIVEMDDFDSEALDLLGPAYIEFDANSQGGFQFIAVEGWMDVRVTEHRGAAAVEFSWDGNDECDAASGRGWAAVADDGSLTGHIYFHLGIDAGFSAVRE